MTSVVEDAAQPVWNNPLQAILYLRVGSPNAMGEA